MGFTATYGEEVGPNTSKTVPTGLRFSSKTLLPIRGTFSALRIMLRLELTWRTWPILCKSSFPLAKPIFHMNEVDISKQAARLIGEISMHLVNENGKDPEVVQKFLLQFLIM